MLKLTRKTEYALLALGDLNRAGGGAATKVREIADHYEIPFPVLAKVMQQLARRGFVEPIQGARGGYRLRANLGEVNLWQFLEVMEGPVGIVDCLIDQDCIQLSSCPIRTPMQVIDHTLRNVFHRMTLEDITRSPTSARSAV